MPAPTSSVERHTGTSVGPSSQPRTLPRGTFVGSYELLEALGSGAMGTVYRARRDGGDVAVKIVHPHLLHNPVVLERFRREARIGMSVRHPNVVRTKDVGVAQVGERSLHYLVMAYERGRTLRSALQKLGCAPEALCRVVARSVASGLAAIHAQGVLHRDLKPENLLITDNHEVRIMDLGVARLQTEAVKLTQTGALVGSLHYAAPEQLLGDGDDLDERADLHSLGVTLYELATGVHPYGDGEFALVLRRILREEPPAAASVNPKLSDFFETIVHALLAKDREERFASAADLLVVLEQGEDSAWWRARAGVARSPVPPKIRRLRGQERQPLRGRSNELGALERWYTETSRGKGALVVVQAPMGAGKTHLIEEFVLGLEGRGESFHYLASAYPPIAAITEPGGVVAAFREHVGAARLDAVLADFSSAAPSGLREIAGELRGESLNEHLGAAALGSGLIKIALELAAERTTVLVIDDFHLAPDSERELLASVARACRESRLLIVCSGDHGLDDGWTSGLDDLVRIERLALRPLSIEVVQALLTDGLADSPATKELTDRIAHTLGGNPLLVSEIISELRVGRTRQEAPEETWERTSGSLSTGSRSSLLDAFHGRMRKLDDDDRHLLTVAACCGFRFDPLLVGEAVGLRPIQVLERLAQIEREFGVVHSDGTEFVFDHPRAHDVLYRRAHPMVRTECHSVIAAVLEARHASELKDELPGPLANRLCRHFLAARSSTKARRYLRPALNHLEGAHMHAALVELADAALEEPGLLTGELRLRVVLRKVGGLRLLGLQEAEDDALDRALELADADGNLVLRARVRRKRGALLREAGHSAEARLVLSEAVDLAAESGDRSEEAWSTIALGDVLLSTGRHHDARELYERALALAADARSLPVEAAAVGALGHVHFAVGSYDLARRSFERQLTLAGAASGGADVAMAWMGLVRTREMLGDLEGATRALKSAEDEVREHRLGNLRPALQLRAGLLAATLGEAEEARERCAAALEAARNHAMPRVISAALLTLGQLDIASGDLELAERRFHEALQLGQALDEPDEIVLAAAMGSVLPGGDAAQAASFLARYEFRLGRVERMRARLLLWQSTGNDAHLSEAHRLLLGVLAKIPAEQRACAGQRVLLYREILDAWSASGAAGR